VEFLRWRAERWMKLRHMPATFAHSPLFLLRNGPKMFAHTFRGSTIRSFLARGAIWPFAGPSASRAYLLAMLFGHEFEVEANEFSLQIASSAMMMVETDRSPALIACADLVAAEDDGT
jgi:hypothetical protein